MRKSTLYKKILAVNGVRILLVGISTLMYSACHSPAKVNISSQKISLIQLLVGNGNHFFRSVDLGVDFKTVLNSEKRIPDENDTDDISYTIPVDSLQPDSVNEPIDSVNYFKITYYFDKDNLNEVDEDIYLQSDSMAANVYERLTVYLSSKYGDYASQNDCRVWNAKHAGKKEWVSLSDESEEYDYGKLSLVFYSEDY